MQVELKQLQLFVVNTTSLKTKQLFGCVIDFQGPGAKSQTPGAKPSAKTSAQPGTDGVRALHLVLYPFLIFFNNNLSFSEGFKAYL